MTALYNGPHGEAWQASKIEIYGWLDPGFNVSSSNKPGFSNAPAAYYVVPNSIQLDQATLYFERPVDTVQTDHVDWGFRFTSLYGRITGLPPPKAFSAISFWERTAPTASMK